MPLQKLQFQPGINRETTSYTNEGGWFDGDKVRFRQGFPEKIGGWEKIGINSFLGSCRALWPWRTLNLDDYLGVGTHLKYYVEYGNGYYDITPIRSTTAAGDVTFAATNGSSTITVSDPSHGAVVNDFVTFSGATSLGGNITADVLNQEYQIAEIIDNLFVFLLILFLIFFSVFIGCVLLPPLANGTRPTLRAVGYPDPFNLGALDNP